MFPAREDPALRDLPGHPAPPAGDPPEPEPPTVSGESRPEEMTKTPGNMNQKAIMPTHEMCFRHDFCCRLSSSVNVPAPFFTEHREGSYHDAIHDEGFRTGDPRVIERLQASQR